MINQSLTKKREYWIDLMRAFACVMVLFCHSPQHYVNQSGQILMPINNYYGMAWGPILFFMISGACILNKEQSASEFLRRRFSRILFPTILWSIIYIFMECMVWQTCSDYDLCKKMLMIPFSPQYGIMWFMYALIAIYLMAPILSVWLNKCDKRELQFYLIIWGLTLVIPFMRLISEDVDNIIKPNGMLYYMSGFLWIAVLGFYCRKYGVIESLQRWHILLAVMVLLSPLYVFVIKHFTGTTISSSLSVDSVATTALAFMFFRNIHLSDCLKPFIMLISKYSFGIYLTHMLIMYPFRIWIAQFNLSYFIQIPLTVLVVGLASFGITFIISKLSFSKFIIG